MLWKKVTSLNQTGDDTREQWIRDDGSSQQQFEIKLSLGKKTDIINLKDDIVSNLQEKLAEHSEARKRLYSNNDKIKYVSQCPVTGTPTRDANELLDVYGAKYVQSPCTGHVYVKNRPTDQALEEFYSENTDYSSQYTDPDLAQSRLNSVNIPLRDWVVEKYRGEHNQKPEKILDVGAGGGHFVEACRRDGMKAEGLELNENSIEFAHKMWDIELISEKMADFVEHSGDYDVVTFWGILEHVPNPSELVRSAREITSRSDRGGLIVSRLPRWYSLSAAAQQLNPDSILRHVDPLGHIMLFTDASAAELYFQNGVTPRSAWFYGMDVYEELVQISEISNEFDILPKLGEFQKELQQYVDENRFSDTLVLTGIPEEQV